MNIISILLVIVLTTIAAAIFLRLVSEFAWFQFPLSAILAYGASMLLIFISRQIVPLSLPNSYFKIRGFEDGGRLYLKVGIKVFRKLLIKLGLNALNWIVRFSGRRSGLQGLYQSTCQAETDHTISFLVLIFLIIYSLIMNWTEAAAWLVLVNVFANIYPVMLQRYNRSRIEPLLEKDR